MKPSQTYELELDALTRAARWTGPEAERLQLQLGLRAAAPLRGNFAQHDASDLALFRAANEPQLF